MKRWILGIVAVIGLSIGAATASAQGHGRHGWHGGGPTYSSGYRTYGGRYAGYTRGYGYGSGYRGGSGWHDTSHYDYHPGSFRRHRGHFDYVPGHYDYHRSGHFDW